MIKDKDKDKDKDGLVDRVTEDVILCLRTAKFRKEGEEKNGYLMGYCTYFQPGWQYEPVDCGYRGEQIQIILGNKEDWDQHYVSFYKCCNRINKKRRRRR